MHRILPLHLSTAITYKYSTFISIKCPLYFVYRLGLIESAKRHLAVTCQADAKEMQNLQIVERHISKCIEARKMGNWRSILSESNAAIAAGADSAPQVYELK